MEREKGFESGLSPAFSDTYATIQNAQENSTRPPDASGRVGTETLGGDTGRGAAGLPVVTPELFLEAGLIVAVRASRALAGSFVVEEFLRQAVRQVAALHGTSVNHG
jgi:hypothetical protein